MPSPTAVSSFPGGSVVHAPAPEAPGDHPRPKFAKDEQGFHDELKRRVAAYFAESGRRERDTLGMYLKTAVILAWFATAYGLLVFGVTVWWLAVPLALAVAIGITAIGFNIAHDGGHHAYSRYGWVNRLAGFAFDAIGASSYLWHFKHGVFHHTYPNVDGQDTDVDAGVVARLSPQQPRRWYHRWQHLYLWPLYAVSASRWQLYTDFREAAIGKIGPHKVPRPRGWDLATFFLGKIISIGLLLVLPMFFHPWWLVVIFYFLVTGAVGVMLTVVFQLAHCVGEADFPTADPETLKMADGWAAHQVRTTVDFARTSRVWTWLLGGLNFQVEHHLFPRICHTHYPALSRIVEQVCVEYGVPYTAHNSFWGGVRAHYRWLRRMGRAEPASVVA